MKQAVYQKPSNRCSNEKSPNSQFRHLILKLILSPVTSGLNGLLHLSWEFLRPALLFRPLCAMRPSMCLELREIGVH
jgi:hypothetical protein